MSWKTKNIFLIIKIRFESLQKFFVWSNLDQIHKILLIHFKLLLKEKVIPSTNTVLKWVTENILPSETYITPMQLCKTTSIISFHIIIISVIYWHTLLFFLYSHKNPLFFRTNLPLQIHQKIIYCLPQLFFVDVTYVWKKPNKLIFLTLMKS